MKSRLALAALVAAVAAVASGAASAPIHDGMLYGCVYVQNLGSLFTVGLIKPKLSYSFEFALSSANDVTQTGCKPH